MKKSSKSVKKRTKSSQNPEEPKVKVVKSPPESKEKEDVKDKEKSSRKTRWESESVATEKETSVTVAVEEAPQRIRDLVDDKEKLVDYLFLTVTGTALEELIPDYLKKCSVEELKKLCAEQIKDMSRECILSVISGSSIEKKEDSSKPSNSPVNEAASEDVSELGASANEMKEVQMDEENQTPTSANEISEELPVPESDAELLELEMRARAIRSLLKAKTQESPEED